MVWGKSTDTDLAGRYLTTSGPKFKVPKRKVAILTEDARYRLTAKPLLVSKPDVDCNSFS